MKPARDQDVVDAAVQLVWRLVDDPAMCPDAADVILDDLEGDCDGCVVIRAGRKVIAVDAESPFFQRAVIGDLLSLAVVIVHEQFHRLHGPDEAPAYASTLNFLVNIGADRLRPDLFVAVLDARDLALGANNEADDTEQEIPEETEA